MQSMEELGHQPRLETTTEDEAPPEADVEAPDLDFSSDIDAKVALHAKTKVVGRSKGNAQFNRA